MQKKTQKSDQENRRAGIAGAAKHKQRSGETKEPDKKNKSSRARAKDQK